MLKKFFLEKEVPTKSYYECSGCGVCSLVCPVFTQQSNIYLTPWGRAKSLQGGASAIDIQDSLESCVSCGACHPLCPEPISIAREDKLLREQINLDKSLQAEDQSHILKAAYNKVLAQAKSQGDTIFSNTDAYRELDPTKSNKVYSLGEWLIKEKKLQKYIQKNDLYWMDAPLFHVKYHKLVEVYDQFRKDCDCLLNWNLHRTAMPLGKDNNHFDRNKQYQWVVFNKTINRILVENVSDWLWLKENSSFPVFHILELMENDQ